MSHEDGHFITEPAASITDPVVAAIQQLEFEAEAMTSDVQRGLVIGIVFGELRIRLHKMLRLSKPLPMPLTIQDQQSRIEIHAKRDFPILCRADMQWPGAFRNGDYGVFPCDSFRFPGVQANHVGIEIHHEIIVDEIEKSQLEVEGSGKTGGGEMLIAQNDGF